MSYYRAEIKDFFIDKVYEQRSGDVNNWRTAVLSEEHLTPQPGGHYHFLEVIINIQRFKSRAPYYKIKHLNMEDILSFGWVEKLDKDYDDSEDTLEFAYGKFELVFYPKTKRIDIYETIPSKSISNVIEKMFTGQILDFNEFKVLLKQLGILIDLKRKEKFNERV